MFKRKICGLHAALKRVKGGNPTKRLLNKWRNSSYNVTIYYDELQTENLDLVKENLELKGEKRSLEQANIGNGICQKDEGVRGTD